jgi:hypothetical protein
MIWSQREESSLIEEWQIGNMVCLTAAIGNELTCAHLMVLVLAVAWFAMGMTSGETAADQQADCDVTRRGFVLFASNSVARRHVTGFALGD